MKAHDPLPALCSRTRSALAFTEVTTGDTAAGSLAGSQRIALSDSETVYGAWVALWDVIEAEEKRREELAAEQFKYKQKSQEIEGDDEALERTLNELFPSYTESFEVKEKRDVNDDEESEQEKVDEDTLAYDIRRMRDSLLGKGELLDVVLQYVCMVSRLCEAALHPRILRRRRRSSTQAEEAQQEPHAWAEGRQGADAADGLL